MNYIHIPDPYLHPEFDFKLKFPAHSYSFQVYFPKVIRQK